MKLSRSSQTTVHTAAVPQWLSIIQAQHLRTFSQAKSRQSYSPLVKWPKLSTKTSGQKLMQTLGRSSVDSKDQWRRNWRKWFGSPRVEQKGLEQKEMGQKQVTPTPPMSRRQPHIKCLVRERRDCKGRDPQRSLLTERAGINLLQADLKECLFVDSR